MSNRIQESLSYALFVPNRINRTLNVHKVRSLCVSMKKYGWLDDYPMAVKKLPGGFEIQRGHHRLEAAKKIGIPVKFIVVNGVNPPIQEIESIKPSWTIQDYADSYFRMGLPSYIELREYCELTEITLQQAVAMLSGCQASTGCNKNHEFYSGDFRITESGRRHADIVGDIVIVMKSVGVTRPTHRQLVSGISRSVFVPEFDVSTFTKKVKAFPSMVIVQQTLDLTMLMLEKVYNYKNQSKIPLRILADKYADSRNASRKSKQGLNLSEFVR